MNNTWDQTTKQAFVQLGSYIEHWLDGSLSDSSFDDAVELANRRNAWFTLENIRFSLQNISQMLRVQNIDNWLLNYTLPKEQSNRIIGVVMAGNIPLVGFHDLLCVLMSGNQYLGKMSGKDESLLQFLVQQLVRIEPLLVPRIQFTTEIIREFDAVIATGSNNSARYFEYYFSRFPSIIRRNRTSVAVLDGSENSSDFQLLAQDVFTYFGLGCRNVSKIYVPQDFAIEQICTEFERHSEVGNHSKFANNYDYNKSLYMLNQTPYFDTGFCLLKEDAGLFSPISVIYFERYSNLQSLQSSLTENADKIQCLVSKLDGFYKAPVSFGQAQKPGVSDYADDVDTLKFLTYLN